MEPSEELERELMEWVFSAKGTDHNKAVAVWKENPWKAVSLYEAARFPEMLELPLMQPKTTPVEADAKMLEKMVEEQLFGIVHIEEGPRVGEGEYEMDDGKVAIVNRFGRVTNPEDIYNDLDF